MPTAKSSDDQYTEEETERRAQAALKRALNTPPKPLSKVKKRRPSHSALKPQKSSTRD
jgi:hypothetical protein